MVTVLFFGPLADLMGRERTVALASDRETAGMILRRLEDENELFQSMLAKTRVKIAVNNQIVSAACVISDGDDVAILPPFSGG